MSRIERKKERGFLCSAICESFEKYALSLTPIQTIVVLNTTQSSSCIYLHWSYPWLEKIESDLCSDVLKGSNCAVKYLPCLKNICLVESMASQHGGFFRRVDHSVLHPPRTTIVWLSKVKRVNIFPFTRHDPSRFNRKGHTSCWWSEEKRWLWWISFG